MKEFTKTKFLGLQEIQQHKKCAQQLLKMYLSPMPEKELENYNRLVEWMGLMPMASIDKKKIADQYHWHLKQGKINIQEHRLLPAIRKGDKAIAASPWPIAVYLDKLRSAHNVGSILRTIEALSFGRVYFSEQMPSEEHQQVQKVSMGTHKWVECFSNVPLKDLPKPIIALETSSSAIPLFDYLFPDEFTLVVGNEEYGCSEETLQQADVLVEIPLRGRKNSLNVANAFAIAAAEISRQKQACHG